MSRKVIIVAIVALALVGGGAAWLILSKPALPPGFAGVNGRLEAKQVDIATKYPGRIKEVLATKEIRSTKAGLSQRWILNPSRLNCGTLKPRSGRPRIIGVRRSPRSWSRRPS
jgi:hypothetical protein